ncbi:type VI secretion system-associated FHA domain protein TagH [Pseudomonas caspiana]|uniref:Uncharacterized protein n=1 Tax=Pseudomonas caspiana TaxID=1451454 RepID=A0A1Y3P102_9PSED|nr:type VI secretion system-associated FHA domain protein TagH [Pseudomonas caspiana]OUM72422.1 hypothetical protein AUC60_17765 [Pseudomonas caspiana]
MPLRLRVTHFCSQPAQTEVSAVFAVNGGTLGRSSNSDLMLDDPSHYVALVQARIVSRADQYYLIQTGINPSAINTRLVESGSETLLQDGDYLIVGDYRIEVIVEPQTAVQEGNGPQLLDEAPVMPLTAQQSLKFMASSSPLEGPLNVPSDLGNGLPDALACSRILDDRPLHASDAWQAGPLGLNLFSDLLELSSPILDIALNEELVTAIRGTRSGDFFPADPAHTLPTLQFGEAAIAAGAKIIPDDYDLLTDVLKELPTEKRDMPTIGSASAKENDSAVFKALLDGLGLPDLHTRHPPVELAFLVGETLREATAGVMELLRTLPHDIGVLEDSVNPLKCVADLDCALGQMLKGCDSTELSTLAAYSEAFDELKRHEQGAIIGMRTALRTVVQRLDPAGVDKYVGDPGVLDKLIPIRRKARMWDQLVAHYNSHNMEEHVQRLLVESFTVASKAKVIRLHHER